MSKLVYNSFHESLLPIGTILMYKNIKCEIVEYDDCHDEFADYYIIQPVGWSAYYQRIVRYNDEHFEVIKND